MVSNTMEKEDLKVSINKKNQLVVDISVKQMNALFKKHHGRAHRSPKEVESFINNLVATKLIERGLLPKR